MRTFSGANTAFVFLAALAQRSFALLSYGDDVVTETHTRTVYTCPCDNSFSTYPSVPFASQWSQWNSFPVASLAPTTLSFNPSSTFPLQNFSSTNVPIYTSTTTTSGATTTTTTSNIVSSGVPFSVNVQINGNLDKRSSYALGLSGGDLILVEEAFEAIGFLLGLENALTLLDEGLFVGVAATSDVQPLTTFATAEAAAGIVSFIDGVLTMSGATFVTSELGAMAMAFGPVPASYYLASLTPDTAVDSFNPGLTGGSTTTSSIDSTSTTTSGFSTLSSSTSSLSQSSSTYSSTTNFQPQITSTTSFSTSSGTSTSTTSSMTSQPNCVTVTVSGSSMLSCQSYPATTTTTTITTTQQTSSTTASACTDLPVVLPSTCSDGAMFKINGVCFSQVCGSFPLGTPFASGPLQMPGAVAETSCAVSCSVQSGCVASWWTSVQEGPSAANMCHLYYGVAGAQDSSSEWWSQVQPCPQDVC